MLRLWPATVHSRIIYQGMTQRRSNTLRCHERRGIDDRRGGSGNGSCQFGCRCPDHDKCRRYCSWNLEFFDKDLYGDK